MSAAYPDLPTYQHGRIPRAVLISLVPVICPAEAVPLADAIVDHMALTLGAAAAVLRAGFGTGLVAYDLGSLLYPPSRGRRAHKLAPAAAARYFASWEHGPTPIHVQLAKAINQLMSLSCYEQPAMLDAIGYRPGPWIKEVTAKRLTVYKDDVAKQAAQILAPDPLRPARAPRAHKKESA